ncbi:PREDICTED: sodium/hydrogen exchanger 9B1 isoform X2 [Chinchilla lanigera]|uniref:sodium/hydrogen exchanger 9B1 isoform X2 n=1 Tax=Chinchilla lanigera TaxID=34839 RepID=UPI00038EAD47|nr:PREDICTED: sodium/hydrogen exchanger 9B1 isoform X2 [Chinchilla lanigera]
MHTEILESKDEKDTSFQSAPSGQTFRDPGSGEHKGIKETVLLNTEETMPQTKKRIYFSCPPQGIVNKIMTNGVIFFMSWCTLWVFLGPEVLPDGKLFGLVIIFYSAILGGTLLQLIRIPAVPPLPPLLGMLLAGFIIRNIPSISEHIKVPMKWSSALRSTALTIILIRAGLGLDPEVLRQMKRVCFRLSFGPCIIEACSAAVFSHFIMDFPWQWGFLLGFVLGAVSPAVVVPSMLRLQEAGYGVEKGIPTVLIAASSMDDIVAITGFNTFLNLIFSQGSILHNVLTTLWDVLVGVLVGTVFGVFIQYFPSEDQEKVPMKRAFLILSMSVSAVLGSQHIGLHGAGGLFTLVLCFTAGLKWTKDKIRVQKLITNAWDIFEPLLFGLVGSEVSVSSLESNAIGENIYCSIVDAQSNSPGRPRSPGSGDSAAQGAPLGGLLKGRDDSGLFSHPDHSPKRGTVHRHPGAQDPVASL